MIAVSHLTTLDASPEDFLDHAAAAGFDGVGLRILPTKHAPGLWPVAGDLPRAKRLRAKADDLGLAVLEIEAFSVWPDMKVDEMLPGLEAGGILGARFVLAAGIDEDEGRLADNFAALCDAAAGFGITVAMEFMPFRPMATLPQALRIHRAVGRKNARLLVDTLHLSRSGAKPADVFKLDRSLLGYIHLCDAAAIIPPASEFTNEARNGRFYPGEGGLPLRELIGGLSPDVPISLEAPNPRYADRSAAQRVRIAGDVTRRFIEDSRAAASSAAPKRKA